MATKREQECFIAIVAPKCPLQWLRYTINNVNSYAYRSDSATIVTPCEPIITPGERYNKIISLPVNLHASQKRLCESWSTPNAPHAAHSSQPSPPKPAFAWTSPPHRTDHRTDHPRTDAPANGRGRRRALGSSRPGPHARPGRRAKPGTAAGRGNGQEHGLLPSERPSVPWLGNG